MSLIQHGKTYLMNWLMSVDNGSAYRGSFAVAHDDGRVE